MELEVVVVRELKKRGYSEKAAWTFVNALTDIAPNGGIMNDIANSITTAVSNHKWGRNGIMEDNLKMSTLVDLGDKVVGKIVVPIGGHDRWAFALTHKTTETVSLAEEGKEFEILRPIKLYNEAKGKRKASYYLVLKGEKDLYSMFLSLDAVTNLKFQES